MKIILVKFITLGCKTNLYESEAMAQMFRDKGYTVTEDAFADIYIINTCTVTGSGAQRSRQSIRKCKSENPAAVIAVTGCYAQTDAAAVAEIEDVDVIAGISERAKIVGLVEAALSGEKSTEVADISQIRDYEELGAADSQSRVRANLKIQDGCDNFCSYCIIPYARGRARSRLPENIVDEAKRLANNGFSEIVITGIHIASYGKDLKGTTLMDIVEQICTIDGIKRVRLGSLEPLIITDDFISRAAKQNKLCKQFHLSLQSGCDETLARMNRKYTTEQYMTAVQKIRKAMLDCSITTDVIVGFPAETDEEFKQSYEFCRKVGFMQMHIFKYSKRAGTKAADMQSQISNKVKEQRSAQMLQIARDMKYDFYKQYIGKTACVLFEQQTSEGRYHGLTSNYIDVLSESGQDICKTFKNVLITGIEGEFLIGEVV